MLLQERSDELYEQLCHELKQFEPGSRFYSIRRIIERFDVSRRVVDATVKRLEKGGLIESVPCRGLFIKRAKPQRSVVFFYPDWPSPGSSEHNRRLREEFAALDGGYDYAGVPFNYQADLIRLVRNCPADVIILAYPAREITREELSFFSLYPKPIIFMERELCNTPLHYTCSDWMTAIALVLSCFRRHGHRRAAFLAAEPLVGGNLSELECFRTLCGVFGLEGEVIDCGAVDGDYTPERAYETMIAYLARRRHPAFTALFVSGFESIKGVLRAFREFELTVPGDVSIIGSGMQRDSHYFSPPMTSVCSNSVENCHRLATAIDRLFAAPERNPEPIRLRNRPVLIEQESVRDLNESTTSTTRR